MKRILFCSAVPLDPRLGMAKHWLELANRFASSGGRPTRRPGRDCGRPTGATCDLPVGASRLPPPHAADYDVVEYDHAYLPFPRSDFPPAHSSLPGACCCTTTS